MSHWAGTPLHHNLQLIRSLRLRLGVEFGAWDAHCSAALRGVHKHDCHNALTTLMQPAAGGGVPEPGPEAAGAQGGAHSGGCQRRPQGSAPHRHHGPLRRRCVVFSPAVPLSAHLRVAAFRLSLLLGQQRPQWGGAPQRHHRLLRRWCARFSSTDNVSVAASGRLALLPSRSHLRGRPSKRRCSSA